MVHALNHFAKVNPRILNPLHGASLHPGISRSHPHYSSPSGSYHHHHGYHGGHSSHGGSGHSHKSRRKSIALSALTLLSFLFFLNILQNCIEDQIDHINDTLTTTTPSTVLILANREKPRAEDDGVTIEDEKSNKIVRRHFDEFQEPVQLMKPEYSSEE